MAKQDEAGQGGITSVESSDSDPLQDVDLEALPSGLAQGMARILKTAKARREASPTPSPESQSTPDATESAPTWNHHTVRRRLADVDASMARLEEQGFFVSFPLRPGSEFPTLLARLPVFRPSKPSHQNELLNAENALEFKTPYGEGKRHGPPLTVRDEDTLIAIMRLRSRRLFGPPHQLPVPMAAMPNEQGTVGVHCVVCSVDQINRELGLTDGGKNFQRTLASVKRLGATTLELNLKRHDRYLSPVETGRMVSLLEVQWQVYAKEGLLVILIPPVVSYWLESEYTYLEWTTRLKLTDLGKCLHRFLSSQPHRFKAQLSKIAATVGYDGPTKNMKPRFRTALQQLLDIGWLEHYQFSGTGRSVPLMLHTLRARSTK